MKQALHIFKKDVRHLRYDIGLTLLAALAFCVAGVYQLQGPTATILPVTWWFLIGRVIHGEALPGNRHFWLTRPYRWQSLLGAKVLFIFTFVHLPLLLANLVILHAAGFSLREKAAGLLWMHVLLLAAFVLPAATFSALTSGLTELLALTLLLVVGFLLRIFTSSFLPGDFSWRELEWVKTYYVVAQIAVAAMIILLWQYARRNTAAMRTLTVALAIALLVSSALLPWKVAFALQTHVSPRKMDLSSVRIEPDADRKWLGRIYATAQDEMVAELPLKISGLPAGTRMKPNGLAMRLRALDNETFVVRQPPPESFSFEADITSLRAVMGRVFYEKVKNQPVQISGTLYFTLYGNPQQAFVPVNRPPVPVKEVGLCSADGRVVQCDSACRPPSAWVLIRLEQDSLKGAKAMTEDLSRIASYSPFPADLSIHPLFRFLSPSGNALSGAQVEAWEPLTYGERNFHLPPVRLNDFAASSPLAAIQ